MPHSPESNKQPISRREMFAGLLSPFRRVIQAGTGTPAGAPQSQEALQAGDVMAVIGGRLGLAYHEIACTACVDRCPVPGALVSEEGLPRVVPALCTGCGLCQPVCPAPENAIRMVPRPPGLARPASPPDDDGSSVERRSSRGKA